MFFSEFGLIKRKYVKHLREYSFSDDVVVGKRVIHYNKENTLFFEFESGRTLDGGYSCMYARDFMVGYRAFKKLFDGGFITYVKNADMGYNGKIEMSLENYPKSKVK